MGYFYFMHLHFFSWTYFKSFQNSGCWSRAQIEAWDVICLEVLTYHSSSPPKKRCPALIELKGIWWKGDKHTVPIIIRIYRCLCPLLFNIHHFLTDSFYNISLLEKFDSFYFCTLSNLPENTLVSCYCPVKMSSAKQRCVENIRSTWSSSPDIQNNITKSLIFLSFFLFILYI